MFMEIELGQSIFSLNMEFNDHLVQDFYIGLPSRNHTQPTAQTQLDIVQQEQAESNTKKKIAQITRQKDSPVHKRAHKNVAKIYDMIRKQINCSTAVTIDDRPKPQMKKQKSSVSNDTFIHQFEQFFKGFIKEPQLVEEKPKRMRGTKKKITFFGHRQNRSIEQQNDQTQFEDEEDLRYTLDQKKMQQQKMDYYQKMKANIDHKVQPLRNKEQKNRSNKHCEVEMASSKDHGDVQKILNAKQHFCRKNDPLRLSRTGLVIRLSQIDRQVKGTNLTLIEDHKVKKNILFQKSLFKNCHSVLSDIETYQQSMADRQKDESKPQTSKSNSRKVGRAMTSGKQRKEGRVAGEDDLSRLKWKQKYLSIQYQCQSYHQKSRNVRGGLKIFKRYCSSLSYKLKNDSQNLRQVLQTEDTNDDEYFNYETLTKLDLNKISSKQSS